MNVFIRNVLLTGAYLYILSFSVRGQFAPPAGIPGTTAISADSSAFIGWATGCEVHRGFINISDTNIQYEGSNRANYGDAASATGKADDAPVSLGDGGYAIVTFDRPISNGPGYDFAVFENSLNDTFLELGFVEVSSDGVNYFRFPAVSNTPTETQISTFGSVDATKIDNLAGKYRALYGTPFDLEQLSGIPGLDITHITQVKVIDVVGCIKPPNSTLDSKGHIVNDPWPTPFNTGGFDLDAVGVIHTSNASGDKIVSMHPMPVTDKVTVNCSEGKSFYMVVRDLSGRIVSNEQWCINNSTLDLSSLIPGIYICTFTLEDGTKAERKLIKH